MQTEPQIAYRNIKPNDRIRARIDKELRHLEDVHPRLISAKITVEGPSGHHRHGDLTRVRLHLALPGGKEVAVSNFSDDNRAHEDVMVALRDAFRAAERQLKKIKPDPRDAAATAGETRLAGEIVRFLAEAREGFIRAEDGAEYFFHAREATDTPFEQLAIGDKVTFRPEAGNKGPMARAVHRRQSADTEGAANG